MFEPVNVGGVTVSVSTLHNEDQIAQLGLQIGDTVLIERLKRRDPSRGRVVKQGEHRRPFKMPTTCPVCGGEVVRAEGRGRQPLHQHQLSGAPEGIHPALVRAASWISTAWVRRLSIQFVDKGLVKNVADLYKLK
jgi:DNA ligase (NAD+)